MSAAGGDALNVEQLFSHWGYRADGLEHDVVTGIDLATEGGMVLGMRKNQTGYPWIYDTERGPNIWLYPNLNAAEQTNTSTGLKSFNTDGHTMHGTGGFFNSGGGNPAYFSQTFRKSKKFFDVVSYTGNGSTKTISHNLGSVPGMIWVKSRSNNDRWRVWHRELTSTSGYYLELNERGGQRSSSIIFPSAPTSSSFTVGSDFGVNQSGSSFVAYVFAHNDGDGIFGPTGDQDIIKCGKYTGTGGSHEVNIGFEPQWLLVKKLENDGTDTDWFVFNSYQGWYKDDSNPRFWRLNNDTGDDIHTSGVIQMGLRINGFAPSYSDQGINANGKTYMYCAIRTGPMGEPPDVGQVYGHVYGSDTQNQTTGLYRPAVAMFSRASGVSNETLMPTNISYRGPWTSGTAAGQALFGGVSTFGNDEMGDIYAGYTGYSDVIQQVFARWPGIFDVVHYKGTGTQQNISHSLGVTPEIMLVKCLSASEDWNVYHKDMGTSSGYPRVMRLNSNDTSSVFDGTLSERFVNAPTDSVFTVGTNSNVNKNNHEFLAYMWATKEGFSKVGSYVGNGSSLNIDMGFTNGARFFVTKCITQSTHWMSNNSLRGIVAGNDVHKRLNLDNFAESSGYDTVDPYNAGITVNDANFNNDNPNRSGETYIYWALA